MFYVYYFAYECKLWCNFQIFGIDILLLLIFNTVVIREYTLYDFNILITNDTFL